MIDCTKCIHYSNCIKDYSYMKECADRDWDGYIEEYRKGKKDDKQYSTNKQ